VLRSLSQVYGGDGVEHLGAMAEATFYFDLGSPYAYLSAKRLERVIGASVAWQPILLGALFKHSGRRSWSLESPKRRQAGMAEVERRARDYGLPPVRWPQPWPGNYLFAMRASTFAFMSGRGIEFAQQAFEHAFAGGHDLGSEEQVLEVAQRVGLDRDEVRRASAEAPVKQALREASDAAHARGVIGVPTLAVAGELFWGDDRLEQAGALLAASEGHWRSRAE
jgi:2-hydroxychromene-2-carboxylate isomerase